MKELEELLQQLTDKYGQIGDVDAPLFEYIHNKCVQGNENDFEAISNLLDKEIENINRIREIVQIEIKNIAHFNKIAEKLENLNENDGNSDDIENLKNNLGASFDIIKASHLILKNDYEKYQACYDELNKL